MRVFCHRAADLAAVGRVVVAGVGTRVVAGLAVVLAACAPPVDLDGLREELRAIHEASIAAHLEHDVDFFTRDLAEDYTVVSGAEILRPTPEQITAQFTNYLSRTDFSSYETTDGPIIGLSDDGSVGWIITRVEVAGTQTDDAGQASPLAFTSAWISLYRRIEGRWIFLANVSNVVAPT